MEKYLYDIANASASENSNSHAGRHDGFIVIWSRRNEGWFWQADDGSFKGPFETSQAAFGDYKDMIDEGYECHVYLC